MRTYDTLFEQESGLATEVDMILSRKQWRERGEWAKEGGGSVSGGWSWKDDFHNFVETLEKQHAELEEMRSELNKLCERLCRPGEA
ncbi:MAG: hypothetical protein V2A79_15025 [Planctomycetota bacterium]